MSSSSNARNTSKGKSAKKHVRFSDNLVHVRFIKTRHEIKQELERMANALRDKSAECDPFPVAKPLPLPGSSLEPVVGHLPVLPPLPACEPFHMAKPLPSPEETH